MARPTLRILFDEALSPRVARALRVLGFNVSHVGAEQDGAPARGSSDAVVLDHAHSTGQVVATSNLDMILLCAERAEAVIWLDPRSRQLRLGDQVVVFFHGIEGWQATFDEAAGPICLRVRRSKTDVLPLEEGARLARQRLKRLLARERSRRRPGRLPAEGQGSLEVEEDGGG